MPTSQHSLNPSRIQPHTPARMRPLALRLGLALFLLSLSASVVLRAHVSPYPPPGSGQGVANSANAGQAPPPRAKVKGLNNGTTCPTVVGDDNQNKNNDPVYLSYGYTFFSVEDIPRDQCQWPVRKRRAGFQPVLQLRRRRHGGPESHGYRLDAQL